MKRIVLFGTGQIAELAHHYFTRDSDHEVVAFTVDGAYLAEESFAGLPVCAFEDLADAFPPDDHAIFVALSYAQLNGVRAAKLTAARAAGYSAARYISSRANVAHPDRIGEHCFVLEDATIQPFTTLGDNVFVWSWSHVGHHGQIAENAFISACGIAGNVRIGANSFVGIGAIVRDNVTIGARCVIGAGALILGDCADDGVYIGAASERARVPSHRLRGL